MEMMIKKKRVMAKEIYTTLVLELGIDPDYVLNHIQNFEIQALYEKAQLKHKEEWEQTRMLAYIQTQLKSKKKLNLTDIMSFPWDGINIQPEVKKEITKEDVERLSERIKHIQQHGRFNNKIVAGQQTVRQ